VFEGKVSVVTGASSGIGKETAVGLAKLGATVVAVVRDPGSHAIDDIRQKSHREAEAVVAIRADLSSQKSIVDASREIREKFPRVDVLVNNAGVFQSKRVLTVDGVETTFAVNVIAPFLLTNLLLDRLKSSSASRIVNVSSDAAKGSKVDFGNLWGEKKFSMFGQYGQSKLALNLITLEFSRRLAGSGVTANFLHPGVIRTNLARDLNPAAKPRFKIVQLFMGSPEKGARTSIHLASSPEVEGLNGKYYGSKATEERAPEASYNEADAKKLWDVCEKLTSQVLKQSAVTS